jgi:hypothetical protein
VEISSKGYQIPPFSDESMAFRFYCATGGLMGYLSKLLKQVLRNADCQARKSILLEDIAHAYTQSIWRNEQLSNLHQPFSRSFELTGTAELLRNVATIGTTPDETSTAPDVRQRKQRLQPVNSMLRIR